MPEQQLKGELKADRAKEIGDKLGIDWNKIPLEEFRAGMQAEREHTIDPETRVVNPDDLEAIGKIAWAHLKELPDYYSRLKEMEKVAEKSDLGMKPRRDQSIDSGPKDVHLRKKLLPQFSIEEGFYISNLEEVPGAKGSRKDFDVEEGDKAKFIVDEHVMRVDEDATRVFKSTTTFGEWQDAKEKGGKVSIHSDIRIVKDGTKYFFGIAIPEPGSSKDESKLFNPDNKKILVVQWKPRGEDLEWMEVGKGKARIFEPGEAGAPGNLWAVMKRLDSGRITFGEAKEHFIEMFVSGTEHMPEGRWILAAAPLGRKRTWFLSYTGKE